MSTASSNASSGSGGAAPDARAWTAFLLWLGAWSLLIGFVDTARSALALERFGGTEYLSRVVVLGATREYAAAICSGAASVALVVWAERQEPATLRARLATPGLALGGAAIAGYFAAVGLIVSAGSAAAALFGGVDWLGFWLPIRRVLAWSDVGVGLLDVTLQTLVVLALAWAGLAWLAARRWSRFWKIALAWFATAAGYLPLSLLQHVLRSVV